MTPVGPRWPCCSLSRCCCGEPPGAGADDPAYGDSGTRVRAIQNQLIAAGYLRAQHNRGTFGARTRDALRAVQRDHDLTPTGKYGPRTRAALSRAVADATGPRTWYAREVIGTSAEGRPITAYRAGERGKPVVLVVATMHGEENFGQYVARGLLEGRRITGRRPVGGAGAQPGRAGS